MPLPPAKKLNLSASARKELLALSRQRNIPKGIALRVDIVLGASEGTANHVLARRLSTSLPTVLLWRRRYEADGLAGILQDKVRSGRPKAISPEQEAAIVEATIHTTPKDATHWSTRTMAASRKVSAATVQRIWKKHKLQPHRVENFKFSTDPEFAPKVRDIVGLYLNPPDKAVVLSVDEKSQLEGTVIAECQPRHRHQEFLRFLHRIDQSVAPELDIHMVLDNYGTHKHPEVKKWLAERPRYCLHFTPTSSYWLNQIERWFAEITRKRIRRGTFTSVRQLIKAINDYVRNHNKEPQPFQWVASASQIIRKVRKYKETSEAGD